MKKSLTLIGCMFAFGLGPLTAFADDATSCSLATLHGTYAFGYWATDSGVPYSTSGMESYDGQGHIKYTQLWNEAGINYTYNGTGTYTITANCIATTIYDGATAHPWTYFVAPDGSVFYFNRNFSTGPVNGGHEDRISRSLLVK
jgi:hypothetical protein